MLTKQLPSYEPTILDNVVGAFDIYRESLVKLFRGMSFPCVLHILPLFTVVQEVLDIAMWKQTLTLMSFSMVCTNNLHQLWTILSKSVPEN